MQHRIQQVRIINFGNLGNNSVACSSLKSFVKAPWCLGLMAVWLLTGCAPPPSDKGEPDSINPEPVLTHSKHRPHHGDRAVEKSDASHHQGPDQSTPRDSAPKSSNNAITGLPDHVLKTLAYVEKHHRAPDGYEGGRVFHNFGSGGEQALPRTDDEGDHITYHEWDVHPKRPGVNRGADRLVTGSDGMRYYTSDHYRTFKKVR